MKKFLFLLFVAIGMHVQSQVSINNDSSLPDNSAMLDVKSTNKGILLPRMTLAQRNAIGSPAAGLMIYQTDNTPGVYYNSGTSGSPAWVMAGGVTGWGLTGNSGTNPATNFIGTTDNVALNFRVNNQKAGRISSDSSLFLGYQAGNSNYGSSNTGIGFNALYSNTEGNENIANGADALYSNTTGSYNTATGNGGLYSNSTANYNTANGYQALYSNSSGSRNTANGSLTLYSNNIGYYNTANGFAALYSNTEGHYNTATGFAALFSNLTGYYNTAIGYEALAQNLDNNNTAAGYEALRNNTTGWQNTAVGSNSLMSNTTGSYHTAVGYNTGPNSDNLFNTTCIGIDATATASDMVRIGNAYVSSIGGQMGWTTLSDGRFKENVKEDVPGLAFITQLRPVSYQINRESVNDFTGVNVRKQEQSVENTSIASEYKTEPLSPTTTGFIAQEVGTAAKNVGFDFSGVDAPDNEKDMYGLRYAEFVVPLVKAVQELSAINEAQKVTNEELKAQNEQLVLRLEKLEAK